MSALCPRCQGTGEEVLHQPRIIDDRCILADSGSAIQLGPSMIRMLGPL